MSNNRQYALRLTYIAIAIGVLAPLLPLLVWSAAHRWFFPDILPAEWSWRAWRYIFAPSSRVGAAFGYSAATATVVTLISLLIGIPAGRALALYNFRGKTAVTFLLLAPAAMPVIAVVMGIHVAFIRYGLADTLPGLILSHLIPVTPYATLIMASVFANYNVDYEGQARTLGARPYQIFYYVTLPAILPGIMVSGMFAFIISWSQYLLNLVIGGGRIITLPVLLFTFANSGDNAMTAALSIVFVAPAILLLAITARYLTSQGTAITAMGET
jgi:putative spermidine/putrescine transport system permease protein